MKIDFVILILAAGLWARGDEISLAADPWCPFTCDGGLVKNGLMVEIATQAFENLGHKVKYETLNWARSIKDAREGRFSAIVGALKADAPDFIFPKESLADQESCYFVKSESSFSVQNPNQLKGKRLGLVQDYSYGEPLDNYIKSAPKNTKFEFISGVDTTKKLIQMLAADRIDVFIEDKSVVTYALSNLSGPDSEKLKAVKQIHCQKAVPLYVAFSPKLKNATSLAKGFDQEVGKLKKSGKVKTIRQKYGLR